MFAKELKEQIQAETDRKNIQIAKKLLSERQLRANRANGCGRDAGCPAPPAQVRTCGIPAYGSYLG
jgi:hypothetical protein